MPTTENKIDVNKYINSYNTLQNIGYNCLQLWFAILLFISNFADEWACQNSQAVLQKEHLVDFLK